MIAEDAILVHRCLRGDSQAMGLLIGRYETDVFGLCTRLLRHRQDAEDVTQEVFLRVFRSLNRSDLYDRGFSESLSIVAEPG